MPPAQTVDLSSNWGPSNYNPALHPSRRWKSTYIEHFLDPTERNARTAYWKKRAMAHRAEAEKNGTLGKPTATQAATAALHPCQNALTISALQALSDPDTYVIPADATKRPYIVVEPATAPLFPTLSLSTASSPKLVRSNSASTLLARTLNGNLDEKWKGILSASTNLNQLAVRN